MRRLRLPAMFLALIATLALAQTDDLRCVSKYGTTACGYGCVAEYGVVKCAETPRGACTAQYGQVTCFDPPSGACGDEKAMCLSKYGFTACGYGCVAEYGQVKCAQTPRGRCIAQSGEVRCFDPQPQPSCVHRR